MHDDRAREKPGAKFRSPARTRRRAGHYAVNRVPERLHKALKLYAVSMDRSLEAVVVEALEEYLARRE
jgi:predicted HicB family RNase H-like nuclease